MLIWGLVQNNIMASRVVSTKLSEEEYGKLVGLCSSTGFTVSKLLKRAILARMNEESPKTVQQTEKPKSETSKPTQPKKITIPKEEERFLYY